MSVSTENIVSVFVVPTIHDLNGAHLERLWDVLDTSEQQKLYRFRFLRDRRRFLVTRALVRCLATEFLGRPAHEWRFLDGRYGKPRLANDVGQEGFEFNVSHTDESIVCIVSRTLDVGIDIEKHLSSDDVVATAPDFFSPEEVRELASLPPADRSFRFFQYWTLKEAFIKLLGVGLSMPLDDFWFNLNQGGEAISVSVAPAYGRIADGIEFGTFSLGENHLGALAIRSGGLAGSLKSYEIIPFQDIRPCELAWTALPPNYGL